MNNQSQVDPYPKQSPLQVNSRRQNQYNKEEMVINQMILHEDGSYKLDSDCLKSNSQQDQNKSHHRNSSPGKL